MFFAKKIITSNIIISSVVQAKTGIAALTYALIDTTAKEKLKGYTDKVGDCKNKISNEL